MNFSLESISVVIASIIGVITIITSFGIKLYQVKGIKNIRSTKFVVNGHKLLVTSMIPLVIIGELHIIPFMVDNAISGDNLLLDKINLIVVIFSNFIVNLAIIMFQNILIRQKLNKIKNFIKYNKKWSKMNNGCKKTFYTFFILPLHLFGTFLLFWLAVFNKFSYMDVFLGISTVTWGIYVFFLFAEFVRNFELPILTPKKIIYIKDKKYNCHYNMVLHNECYILDKSEVILICYRGSNFTMTVKKENIEDYRIEYRILHCGNKYLLR